MGSRGSRRALLVFATHHAAVALGGDGAAALGHADGDPGLAGPHGVLALAAVAAVAAADRLGTPALLEAGVAGPLAGLASALALLFDVADAGDELAGPRPLGAVLAAEPAGQLLVVAPGGGFLCSGLVHSGVRHRSS